MLSKIDNNDLTVQLESGKSDVWVPDGLAISKRNYNKAGLSLVPPTIAATSINEDEHTVYFESNEYIYSFGGKQKAKVRFIDATISGSNDNPTLNKDFGRSVGPIIIQNKIPIPVTPGMQVSMAGVVKVRQSAQDLIDGNGTKSPVMVRIDLWAVGYEEDEYGEETDIKLNLMAFTQNLQNISGSLQPVGSNLITYTLPEFDYMTVPQGCDRVFMTVSYLGANELKYSSLDYNPKNSGFFGGTAAPSRFLYMPTTNPLRILIKQSDSEPIVVDNALSKTGAAFKNRPFYQNVFPLFDYFDVSNSGFSSDFINWEGATSTITISTDSPHTGNKCVKVINSGQIMAPAVVASPGERIYMSAWMRNIDFSGTGGLRIQSRTGVTWTDIGSGAVTASNSQWIKTEIKALVPAGADAVRLRVAFSGTGTVYFDDIEGAKLVDDSELTFMGTPSTGTNIEIYEWNGARGALIKSDSVLAGQKKTIDVSSITGMIEVVKPGAVTPADMGVNKTGDQVIATSVWTKVTEFTVRSDMLGTNLNNNNLVMDFAGKVTIEAYIKFLGAAAKHEKGVRVLKNGVVIANASFTTKFETTGMSGKTSPLVVAVGDIISFEAYSDSVNANQRTVSLGTHFEVRYAVANQAGNDFYVESVLAKEWDYLDSSQNHLESIQYINVVDDVSSISIERSEADAGTMSLKFCSDNLDPRTNALLQIGKQIRILARHYGSSYSTRPANWVGESLYETVFVAKIKRIEVTYDYENEPQITVTAYDGFQKVDSSKLGLAYDSFEEYGPALNNTGIITKIDDLDWSGPQNSFPGELFYFPSTYGDMSMMDALIMTRNSLKKYVWFNKKNELIIDTEIDNDVKLEFTDGTISGDLSMGNVKQGIDTESIINAIDIEENLLDRSSLMEREASTSEPPEMFKTIEGKKRTVRYQDNASISAFGEYSKKFQVVRGSGSYEDLKNDNYGSSYIAWAQEILEDYSLPRIYISEITSPVKDSATMYMLAMLDILDRIYIHYQFDTYDVKIRSIKISITPGKWFYTYTFLPKSDQTYW